MIDLEPWLPFGTAMRAFHAGDTEAVILVHDDYGDRDIIPVRHFFRPPSDFGLLEMAALESCRGRVVDVGAGAGFHSFHLQERGLEVCAIDVLPEVVEILRARGVVDIRQAELFDLEGETFDTVLMLMNGIGLTATVSGLGAFLTRAHSLVADGGQILADSTDVRAAFGSPGAEVRGDGRYLGEITLQIEFGGCKGDPFPYLYADEGLLETVARSAGWHCDIVCRDPDLSYLARMTRL